MQEEFTASDLCKRVGTDWDKRGTEETQAFVRTVSLMLEKAEDQEFADLFSLANIDAGAKGESVRKPTTKSKTSSRLRKLSTAQTAFRIKYEGATTNQMKSGQLPLV